MVNKVAISTDTDLYDPGLKNSVKAGLLMKLAALGWSSDSSNRDIQP